MVFGWHTTLAPLSLLLGRLDESYVSWMGSLIAGLVMVNSLSLDLFCNLPLCALGDYENDDSEWTVLREIFENIGTSKSWKSKGVNAQKLTASFKKLTKLNVVVQEDKKKLHRKVKDYVGIVEMYRLGEIEFTGGEPDGVEEHRLIQMA